MTPVNANETNSLYRVLIADDEPIIREGIRGGYELG